MEMQIIQKSFECIKTTTGRVAPKQNKWLITQHDLDHCSTIGRGGFSTVSKAQFRGTMVAVKTLKDAENVKEVGHQFLHRVMAQAVYLRICTGFGGRNRDLEQATP